MSKLVSESQLDFFAENDYLLLDNFLHEQHAKAVLEDAKYWKEQDLFKDAGVGNLNKLTIKENYRNDKIKWINEADCLEGTRNYLLILAQLMQEFNEAFFLSLKDYESMYAVYPIGSFYKKHTDRFKQQPHRIISLVFYLNENWQEKDEGQLKLYLKNETIAVNPIFNRLALFKSELLHEVVPCKMPRYSVTSWMKDQINTVNFL